MAGKSVLKLLYVIDEQTGERIEDRVITSEDKIMLGGAGQQVLSKNGQFLATVIDGEKRKIKIWETETGKQLQTMAGFDGNWQVKVAFSPDSKKLLTCCMTYSSPNEENIPELWDVRTGKLLKTFKGFTHTLWEDSPIAFSADGKTVGGVGFYMLSHSTFFAWDVESGAVSSPSSYIFGTMAISNNFSATFLNNNNIYEIKTGKLLAALNKRLDADLATFSPDNSLLVTDEDDGIIGLWRVSTGEHIISFRTYKSRIINFTLSRDNKFVIFLNEDGAIGIWRIADHKEVGTIKAQETAGIQSFILSDDNKTLVTRHNAGVTKVWRVTLPN